MGYVVESILGKRLLSYISFVKEELLPLSNRVVVKKET